MTFNKYHVIESPFKVLINEVNESVRNFEKQTNSAANLNNLRNRQSQQQSSLDAPAASNSSLKSIENGNSTAIGSVCLLSQKEFNDLPSLEYELNNWNNQLNNSLNKIMDSPNIKPVKRALTPITDTSEEESQETSKLKMIFLNANIC